MVFSSIFFMLFSFSSSLSSCISPTSSSSASSKVFASFPISAIIHVPDFYVEERIARKLIRMRLDLGGLGNIRYYRIMDTSTEEIVLYNLDRPHTIPLNLGKREGLFDRMGKRIGIGVMQSFEVLKGNANVGDSYNHIRKRIDPSKTYGLINASESAADPKNNIVAIFEIIQKQKHKIY